MREIVNKLKESRQIKLAKEIVESAGYEVVNIDEDTDDKVYEKFKSNMKANPTYKRLAGLCKKYGYTLYDAYIDGDEGNWKQIVIKGNDRLHPEIYYSGDYYGTRGDYFTIQTTSYGSFNSDKYKEFLGACQDAYNLVLELEKADLGELYVLNRANYKENEEED